MKMMTALALEKTEAALEMNHAGAYSDYVPLAETPRLRTGLTIDDIAHPAYMLNYNCELTWYNEMARKRVLGFETAPAGTESRNVFLILARGAAEKSPDACRELTRLFVSLVKPRVSKAGLLGMVKSMCPDSAKLIETYYDTATVVMRKMVVDLPCTLEDAGGATEAWQVYGIYFREGILIIHVPAGQIDASVLEFISRRHIVVQNLMRKQLPVFTPLAVLAANLDDVANIRAALPPEEYFELINDIWITLAPVFRKHRGTCGKHVGDGIRQFFLPQPDSNYMANAEACAREMQVAMQTISARWQQRKRGLGELKLVIAMREQQEWLAALQSAAGVEFAPLPGAPNRPAPSSNTVCADTLRAIKILGEKLMAKERARSRAAKHCAIPAGRAFQWESVSALRSRISGPAQCQGVSGAD